MNTKMNRHYNYLDRVQQLNEEEIKLIDRDLVKDGKPTYSVKNEKTYNTKFMQQNEALLERLNKSSKSSDKEQ